MCASKNSNFSEGYVSADYLRRSAELGSALKLRSYEMMAIEAGVHVLDVGCGPGIDVVALAEKIGAGGAVTGVDIDEEMLAQGRIAAEQAGVSARVEFLAASAERLPWSIASFDTVRAERLLQVLPAAIPSRHVIGEMLRVLRPGGRLVVADTDWATASVNFSDAVLERRMLGFFAARMRPNGYAGRQLLGLLRAEGLDGIEVEALPFLRFGLRDTPYGEWLPDEALAAGVVSAAEAAQWKDELARREADGNFFASVAMFIAGGRKPQPRP